MDLNNFPPELIKQMSSLLAEGQLKIPPPIFLEMKGEFITLDLAEKTSTVRFPVRERYQNPMGFMQGGMIAAALDNSIGPLSFMVAPPNVTKKMEVNYLRPISDDIEFIIVEARFERREGRNLFFTAKVIHKDGTIFAKATSHHVITKQSPHKQKGELTQ